MSRRAFFAGVCASLASFHISLGAMVFTTAGDSSIEDGNCEIGIVGYKPGWATIAIKEHFTIDGRWSNCGDGSARGDFRLECVNDCDLEALCLVARFKMEPVVGREWRADGMARVLPEKLGADYRLAAGKAAAFDIPLPAGRMMYLTFPSQVPYYAQDSRRWGPYWTMRFGGFLSRRTFAMGDAVEFHVILSSDTEVRVEAPEPVEIHEGAGWVRLDYRKHPVKGSALDWSGMELQDAPAGKHGWLKNVDGHFEFEDLPGVEQRFYGVNLCYDANYPTHANADMLVERLVRCGYNSVRVHHHDDRWVRDDESRDRLDYLIHRCLERGLYITTDLYVSRRPQYRDIGIDKDGAISGIGEYKRAVATNDLAFGDWCAYAESFLRHVNPYTRRSYLEEPGLPLISLVNEGGENETVWERCSAFLRSLGARALLTNDNNGSRHGEGEGLVPRYDYVDNHFYVDHPEFLEKNWRLPSHCSNANPVMEGGPAIFQRGWAKGASRPYTITEWNFSGPGRYRAVGGLLTGSLASEQEWDGLWRFAFSHSDRGWDDSPASSPGYFDCASDPLMAATDRAGVCLFLRGDAATATFSLDKASGSMAVSSPRTCGGFAEEGRIDAGPLSAVVSGAPATLWASSLDDEPLERSRRILLVHLTDVQGDGTRYADRQRRTLLSWGRGYLVEDGSASISLRIDAPEECAVFEIDTAGNRIGALSVTAKDGALAFTVSTRGPNGGRIYYEIARGDDDHFPSYRQTFEATFRTESEAAAAQCAITPLPEDAKLAFGCRWDDTNPMHLDKAAMMERAGVKGTFYICPKDNEFVKTGLGKLMAGGHAIGNHTIGHPDLFTINLNAGFRAIAEGRVALETVIQHPVTSFVVPYAWGNNPIDPEHRPILAASLTATGHFVTQDNPVTWNGAPDATALMPTWRFSADDKNPSRDLFESGLRKMLDSAKNSPDIPRIGLGTHSWCDAEGNALQEQLLKEHCLNPDWAQLNDWEYGAYRYEALHGGVRKVSVNGDRAIFEATRFFPAQIGADIPLSLMFSGAEPLSVGTGKQPLGRGGRGTWTLPHSADARHLHERIARADDGGRCPEFPGLQVSVSPDEEKGVLRIRMENRTGRDLKRIYVEAAFPPKWSNRNGGQWTGFLADGATFDCAFDMGVVARKDYAFGAAYYPVSVDFADGYGLFRIWCEKTMPRVEVPATAPALAARVWGPTDATALEGVDWAAASVPGAPLPDESNWRHPKSSPDSLWSVVDDRRSANGDAGAEVRALAADPAQGRYVEYDFDMPEARVVRLRSTVASTRRNVALWVNGERVTYTGPNQTINVRKGRNRLILRADLVVINDWWTDTLHIAVTGTDGFSEIF